MSILSHKKLPAFIFLLTLLWGSFLTIAAQENNFVLNGKVYDAKTNLPLEGATIQIKGSTNKVVSEKNGAFNFQTYKKPPVTLIVSYVGYQAKEITVTSSDAISIQLSESTNQLDDLVVVGYGTRERRKLVGSVTKINPSETKTIPEGSFDAQLAGKVPGVQIATNTGVPGADVFIRVRGTTSINGTNSPLYIVDGVYVNNAPIQYITQERAPSPMADLNPADIESVEILKDASATAIYGSRGANGVIIVTTKRGKYQQKAKVDFSLSNGVTWNPANRMKGWDLVTGEEHATLINEYDRNMGIAEYFRPVAQGGQGLPSEQKTYDRMALLEQTGRLQDYNVAIHGGSEKTKYYLGFGYSDQDAVWKPFNFKRASLKFTLDSKLNDYITIGTSNTLSGVFRDQGRAANGTNGTLLQASLNIPTYLPIFSDAGVPLKWGTADNISVITQQANVKAKNARLISNFYIDVALAKNLKFRSSWGLDYTNNDESEFWGTQTLVGAAPVNGKATSSITRATGWMNEQTLNYNNKIGEHSFGILVGNTIQQNTIQNTTATGTNFPNNSLTLISAASNQTAAEDYRASKLVSYFSSVNYDYLGRYLLEASFRADASSRFGANHRWGYFPSVGAAWRIKQESFLKKVEFISDLKLRSSYGVTGNQDGIGEYASQGLWGAGFGYADAAGSSENPGLAPIQSPNPDLKWEKTTQFNIGVDASFFKGRVDVEFNWYNKYTRDVLLQVSVPTTSGFSSYYSNFGEISNKGFELGISTINIKNKNFSWNTSFNVSQNNNLVEKIASSMNYGTRDVVRIEQGKPLYSYWMYNQIGVNPQTGDIIFEDVNKDGAITSADRYLKDNAWPKFFGGLTNNLRYKNFDLAVSFNYSYGSHIYNLNKVFGERGGSLGTNRSIFKSQLDRWTTPGQITDLPRLTSANYSIYQNSRYVEDASFIRLRQVSVGYTFKNVKAIQSLRVYAAATNLFLITSYTGADPETNMGVGGQNTQGYDYGTPPQPRTFLVGVNFSL